MANADRLIELFNEAKAKPAGAERDVFLAETCGNDAELREQVVSLLQANERVGDFLQNTSRSPTVLASEKPGEQIGNYQLLEQLGEGGCGIVYMAEQLEPVRRRVALKVIKLGMDTRQVVARFEAERQALALMDHPNIAKVFDAGATNTGRPFFVMELVRGIKITDYCNQNQLSTHERLELFIQVCQAIQHAHQKGIIHRDVKPSNILVAQHDPVSAGCPKVIDFGIAKATSDQPLTDKTLFTAFEQFMGTPAYMSPEQAQLSGRDIDTRTDIYSLGVLLYELLTERTPFDTQELMRAGLDELRRTILEKEPLRPSTRLNQELAAAKANKHASRSEIQIRNSDVDKTFSFRQLNIKEIIPLLRGDLDWIVMKCLEKERTRRYETATGLAADLKRHLRHEPVVARPPSKGYRFGKFARRHTLAVAAALGITIALIAGLIGVLWQSAARQKALAETQRLLYAADMNLAQQALESINLGRAAELLDRHRPQPGQSDLRGFEWRYLWRLTQGDEQATLRGHTDIVTCVAFSPDGRLLASSSKDQTVRLWQIPSQRPYRVLSDQTGRIYSVAFSSNGSQLVAAGLSGVTTWNTGDWAVRHQFNGEFRSTAFTRDGQTLVAATKARVTVLTTARGTAPFHLPNASGPVVFSPDEQHLATLSRGGINIWSARSLSSTATPLSIIHMADFDHSGEHELAFSSDGQVIATGDIDGNVLLFDPVSGRKLAAFEHLSRIDSLSFSPDGKTLASASVDQTVKLWDVAGKTNLATLRGHQGGVWSVAFSPDGHVLATGSIDQTVKLWKAEPDPLADYWQLPGSHSRICAGGKMVANWQDSRVQFLSIDTKKVLRDFNLPAQSDYGSVSESGQTMAVVSNGWVHVWNTPAETESIVFPLQRELVIINSVRISPDGSALAVDCADSIVRWWSLPSGREQPNFPGALVELLDDVVVTMKLDNTVVFWDRRTGRESLVLKGHRSLVRGIAFSPGGKSVATACWDHTARLWELATGREIGVLRGHKEGLESIDFSPDGRTLATGSSDDTIKLWNVATQQEVLTLRPRHGDIMMLKFVPDGSALISLSLNGHVKTWHAPQFKETDAPSSR